mmetsp:Transcript_62155/g.108730  ORF Transcript_62155/g.108730 Transcript_62155/m.108730 type:complete len:104 (+) Transcript_62155:53-364(+)
MALLRAVSITGIIVLLVQKVGPLIPQFKKQVEELIAKDGIEQFVFRCVLAVVLIAGMTYSGMFGREGEGGAKPEVPQEGPEPTPPSSDSAEKENDVVQDKKDK